MNSGEMLLVDTDAGLDDAYAILMALTSPNVTVVGITTVAGNTNVHQVTKNVLRLLKTANRLEIPVYKGSEKPLIRNDVGPPVESNYHGNDGFGDVVDENPPDLGVVQKKSGVQALLDITKEYEGQITLVALGPLTNIALAIRLEPEFGKRLKSCYIMGGNYKGQGNITHCAEFNFYSDPEAAHIVLHDLGCPITLVCWELCVEQSFSWEKYAEFRTSDTPMAQFIKTIEKKMVEQCREKSWDSYVTCDEICMACAVNNAIKTKSRDYYCSVELQGSQTRGSLTLDRYGILGKKPNVNIVMDINKEKYEVLLRNVLK